MIVLQEQAVVIFVALENNVFFKRKCWLRNCHFLTSCWDWSSQTQVKG